MRVWQCLLATATLQSDDVFWILCRMDILQGKFRYNFVNDQSYFVLEFIFVQIYFR